MGAQYEVTGSTVTKYYYAGTQRIAMRTNGTLNYLLGDHLGSTSLTTNASGQVVSELRYKAWGEVRYASGNAPTKYQYTGQFSYESEFGLYFYNARWYDSSLGRFAQADSIVPDGVQGYDRYAYTNNSPLRYTDPTGHRIDDGNVGNHGPLNCSKHKDYCTQNGKPLSQDALAALYALNTNKNGNHNICKGSQYTCQGIVTEPATVTPSAIQSDETFTDYGPENPPTVNGQTFTPAYGGGGQITISAAELLLWAVPLLHYDTSTYSGLTGSNAQGVILVVHNNASGMNTIPGVAVSNNTGMYVNVSSVSVNAAKMVIENSTIPSGDTGTVKFANPVILPITNISVRVNFQVIQHNGVMFGYGQIKYTGPNYVPIYGPPAP